MRGSDEGSGSLFSYVDLEARVRPDHPLRTIRWLAKIKFNAWYPNRRAALGGGLVRD
jgi:hypothetical protein